MAFRIVFLGTPEFAAVSLRKLLETGATMAGVVTAPDRPRGRAMRLQPTPVRALAEKAGIPVLTPADVNAPDVLQSLKAWAPNVIVVVAFGQILKETLLALPPLGCVNVHPSLLPQYRGAAPMQRAIMDGQKETGMTICRMVRKLDSGDILLQERIPLAAAENYGLLHDRMAALGAEMLTEALKLLAAGKEKPIPQNDRAATYAPKISPQEEWIRWEWPAARICDMLRALDPAPGARTIVRRNANREEVKIWSAFPEKGTRGNVPGAITGVTPTGLCVAAGEGVLSIQEVQSVGKKRMGVAQWLQGHPIHEGDRFEIHTS